MTHPRTFVGILGAVVVVSVAVSVGGQMKLWGQFTPQCPEGQSPNGFINVEGAQSFTIVCVPDDEQSNSSECRTSAGEPIFPIPPGCPDVSYLNNCMDGAQQTEDSPCCPPGVEANHTLFGIICQCPEGMAWENRQCVSEHACPQGQEWKYGGIDGSLGCHSMCVNGYEFMEEGPLGEPGCVPECPPGSVRNTEIERDDYGHRMFQCLLSGGDAPFECEEGTTFVWYINPYLGGGGYDPSPYDGTCVGPADSHGSADDSGANGVDNDISNPPPTGECGDGIQNEGESCDDGNTASGDGCSNDCRFEIDSDGDGILDEDDSCPFDYGPFPSDFDEDGIEDACDDFIEDTGPSDPDKDADGVLDTSDNCPEDSNTDQEDLDGDEVGDACDDTVSDIEDIGSGGSYENDTTNGPGTGGGVDTGGEDTGGEDDDPVCENVPREKLMASDPVDIPHPRENNDPTKPAACGFKSGDLFLTKITGTKWGHATNRDPVEAERLAKDDGRTKARAELESLIDRNDPCASAKEEAKSSLKAQMKRPECTPLGEVECTLLDQRYFLGQKQIDENDVVWVEVSAQNQCRCTQKFEWDPVQKGRKISETIRRLEPELDAACSQLQVPSCEAGCSKNTVRTSFHRSAMFTQKVFTTDGSQDLSKAFKTQITVSGNCTGTRYCKDPVPPQDPQADTDTPEEQPVPEAQPGDQPESQDETTTTDEKISSEEDTSKPPTGPPVPPPNKPAPTEPVPFCGNGALDKDKGEMCDCGNRPLEAGEVCGNPGDLGHVFKCDPFTCIYRFPVCGDGVVDTPGEECDVGGRCSDDKNKACNTSNHIALTGGNTDCGEDIACLLFVDGCDHCQKSPTDPKPGAVNPPEGEPGGGAAEEEEENPGGGNKPASGEEEPKPGEEPKPVTQAVQTNPPLPSGGRCGDGIPKNSPNEECDDGNKDDTDICLSTCTIAQCGDGKTYKGRKTTIENRTVEFEYCDDGKDNNGTLDSSCSDNCYKAICADTQDNESDGTTDVKDIGCYPPPTDGGATWVYKYQPGKTDEGYADRCRDCGLCGSWCSQDECTSLSVVNNNCVFDDAGWNSCDCVPAPECSDGKDKDNDNDGKADIDDLSCKLRDDGSIGPYDPNAKESFCDRCDKIIVGPTGTGDALCNTVDGRSCKTASTANGITCVPNPKYCDKNSKKTTSTETGEGAGGLACCTTFCTPIAQNKPTTSLTASLQLACLPCACDPSSGENTDGSTTNGTETTENAPVPLPPDILALLDLDKNGTVTQEEFEAQKETLLSRGEGELVKQLEKFFAGEPDAQLQEQHSAAGDDPLPPYISWLATILGAAGMAALASWFAFGVKPPASGGD